MKKKTTRTGKVAGGMSGEIRELVQTVRMIANKMATQDDIARLYQKTDDVRMELAGKIDGLSRRQDYELDVRKSLEVRVDKLEKKVLK